MLQIWHSIFVLFFLGGTCSMSTPETGSTNRLIAIAAAVCVLNPGVFALPFPLLPRLPHFHLRSRISSPVYIVGGGGPNPRVLNLARVHAAVPSKRRFFYRFCAREERWWCLYSMHSRNVSLVTAGVSVKSVCRQSPDKISRRQTHIAQYVCVTMLCPTVFLRIER